LGIHVLYVFGHIFVTGRITTNPAALFERFIDAAQGFERAREEISHLNGVGRRRRWGLKRPAELR
jgi:hypothetical protein